MGCVSVGVVPSHDDCPRSPSCRWRGLPPSRNTSFLRTRQRGMRSVRRQPAPPLSTACPCPPPPSPPKKSSTPAWTASPPFVPWRRPALGVRRRAIVLWTCDAVPTSRPPSVCTLCPCGVAGGVHVDQGCAECPAYGTGGWGVGYEGENEVCVPQMGLSHAPALSEHGSPFGASFCRVPAVLAPGGGGGGGGTWQQRSDGPCAPKTPDGTARHPVPWSLRGAIVDREGPSRLWCSIPKFHVSPEAIVLVSGVGGVVWPGGRGGGASDVLERPYTAGGAGVPPSSPPLPPPPSPSNV